VRPVLAARPEPADLERVADVARRRLERAGRAELERHAATADARRLATERQPRRAALATDQNNAVWSTYQETPGGAWSAWYGPNWAGAPAGGFTQMAACEQNNGCVAVFGIDMNLATKACVSVFAGRKLGSVGALRERRSPRGASAEACAKAEARMRG